VILAFAVLQWKALRSRYDMRYLPPSAFRAADGAGRSAGCCARTREVAPAEVAVRVDHYLASFRARQKWKVRLALVLLAYWPLLTLRPAVPHHVPRHPGALGAPPLLRGGG